MSDTALHRLTDALPHMAWLASADGSPVFFNQLWLDYSGLSLADSLAEGWAGSVHADDKVRACGLWAQALASGEAWEAEYRLRRADGVYRWMLGRAVVQRDAAGQPTQWLATLTDVDDIRQANLELEKKLSIKRIAGRVARLGGWTIDLPEWTLTWSDESCRIHEVPPGHQPTLEEGLSYFLPEDRATVSRLVNACAKDGTPYEFVLRKKTAGGRLMWVRSLGEAVRDEAGNIVRIQGAFQDITEHKAAEARMLALEAQLTSTLESITDGFALMDREWNFVFLNSQAERVLRRGRSELLGKNLWSTFPDIAGTYVERDYRAAVTEQRTAHIEAFYRPLKTWFVFHVYPTQTGSAIYFEDITQRRAEQTRLRLLETAVSRLNDVVIIAKSPSPGEAKPHIVFVNDAFERHTGFSREEAIGKAPGFRWGAHAMPAELEQTNDAVRKGEPIHAEVLSYTREGAERWLEIDVAPIANSMGKYTHWVAIERDISERKQQREEILRLNGELEQRVLMRTAQLAAANKELEAFAYSVSHDLRSPLNTIHGFSKLLAKLDAENISDKGKHYLDRIGAGVEQMADLIEGLLTLAQLSRAQIKSEPVDLSAMARLIERNHCEREPLREARVNVQDGLNVQGDPRLLYAVLQNLMGNAWKFSSKKAQTQIDVGAESGADGEPIFFIRDNGAGFDMAFAHKLFGTFERLHSPGDFNGTGIGLATVKRVIERHGGRVWAHGQLDQGAVFYFTLGHAADAAQTVSPTPKVGQAG